MKPKALMIMVVIISLLAIAVFAIGVAGISVDFNAHTLADEQNRKIGGLLLQTDLVCGKECAVDCSWQKQTMTITMEHKANCKVQISASAENLRRGSLEAQKGEIQVTELIYETENRPLVMGAFTLSALCGQQGNCDNDKKRLKRELQFSERGGSFVLICKSPAGCSATIPEMLER